MRFTYEAYFHLMDLLKEGGYALRSYHDYQNSPRCAIVRHDIDTSLPDAVRMGAQEAEHGIRSTYFVLLRTDFYNPASAASSALLRSLHDMGHEVGLHSDEVSYPDGAAGSVPERIAREAGILADICGFPIRAVSMHRPSRATLDADYEIPGLVNSYGNEFFHGFKYLSDSRRHWREPVENIVRSGQYPRVHILTHPFWYHETDLSIEETVGAFLNRAYGERYLRLEENIRDFRSIIPAPEGVE